MRPELLRTAVLAGLLLSTLTSIAQTKAGDVVTNVPFPFRVAGHEMPAGHYVVNTALDLGLGIHNRQNQGTFVITHSVERAVSENTTKLVFHRYGSTYFLSEVWIAGNTIGKRLFPSSAEREAMSRTAERAIAVVRIATK